MFIIIFIMYKTTAEPMSTYMPKLKMWEYFRLAQPRASLQHRTLPRTVPPPTNPSSSQDNNEQGNEDSKGHITFTAYPPRQADWCDSGSSAVSASQRAARRLWRRDVNTVAPTLTTQKKFVFYTTQTNSTGCLKTLHALQEILQINAANAVLVAQRLVCIGIRATRNMQVCSTVCFSCK